jgi:hypothetical protein
MGLERHVRMLALGLTCASAVACTEWAPASDRIPDVNETMLQGGEGAGADWSCLGAESTPPPPPGAPGTMIVYSQAFVDLATGDPVTDATVRACGLTDITCANPVSDVIRTDAEGSVSISLVSSFRGYLEVVSPRMIPYIVALPDGPLRTMRDYPVVLISPESFLALVMALQIPADANSGAIGARAFDCDGNTAAGVRFRSTAGGSDWYFENGLPNRTRLQTDDAGLGGFAGTAPGVALFEAMLVDGTPVVSRSLFVRGGWLTSAFMRPPAAVAP